MYRVFRFLPGESWLVFLFFVVCTVLLYGRTLFFDYVYLDDTLLVRDSQAFLSQPGNLVRVFTGEVFESASRHGGIFYRPLLTLSFLIDAQMFRFAPWGFRITNLILHAVSGFLLYLVLCHYTTGRLSFFLSLFFLTHPLFTAAVAWIPGRNDTLLAVFVLASYLCFLSEKDRIVKGIGGHVVFFALALFTKETAAVLPIVCLFTWFSKRQKPVLWLLPAWLILPGIFFFVRRAVVANAGSYTLSDMAANVWLQVPGMLASLGKVFFPVTLSVYPHVPDMQLLPGVVASIVLFFTLFFSRKKNAGVIMLGLLWFFLFLLPTLTIRDQYSNGIAREHRMYVPMVGLLLVFSQIRWLQTAVFRKAGILLIAGVLTLFAGRTVLYTEDFRNSISFWGNAARTSPTAPVAQLNLGAAYVRASRPDDALASYEKAAALAPMLPGVWNNMGVIYMEEGKSARAKEAFLKELKNPASENGETHAIARRNLERLPMP